jgi:hypothetical protein
MNPLASSEIPSSSSFNKKRKITYDDILSSLRLKVNNGILEILPPTTTIPTVSTSEPNMYPHSHPHETRDSYRRRALLEVIRKREAHKKIAEIKSKKLLFARENPYAPTTQTSNNHLNQLFRFSK